MIYDVEFLHIQIVIIIALKVSEIMLLGVVFYRFISICYMFTCRLSWNTKKSVSYSQDSPFVLSNKFLIMYARPNMGWFWHESLHALFALLHQRQEYDDNNVLC